MEDLVPAPLAVKTKTHSSSSSSSSLRKRETFRKYINPKRLLVLAHRKKQPAASPSKIKPPSPAMSINPRVAPRNGAMNVIDLVSDSDDDGEEVIVLASSPPPPAPAPAQQPLPLPQQQPLLPQQDQPNGAPPARNNLADLNQMDPFQLPNDDWQDIGNYVDDAEFNEEMIAQLFGNQPNRPAEEVQFEPPAPAPAAPQFPVAPPPLFAQPNLPAQPFQQAEAEPRVESRSNCIQSVVTLFPDICQNHVGQIYDTIVGNSSDLIIASILDKVENGSPYPKRKDNAKTLKRKRELTEEEVAVQKYGAADRESPLTAMVIKYIKDFLSCEFKSTPKSFIDSTLSLTAYRLFHAYRVLEQAEREWSPVNPAYNKLKTCRKMENRFRPENLQAASTSFIESPDIREIILEIQAARKVRAKADEERAAEHLHQLAEDANEQQAKLEGTMSECGCCFGDYPMNRMIHCDSDTLHWFCRGCAKQMADTEIGASRYLLGCMSMDVCKGGFSNDQRLLFLDESTMIALERTEQETMLRLAGIENLASCPFCPYAAEYPPVEVNKEFQCQAPDCEKVSCRLCKLESHIPKSCEEFAKENGLSIRRQIEEAMSAALIRKCNKCSAPFIKEEGCNKMMCTKCGNLQCYICSESCDYKHFNDTSRGGKAGNCPLFDEKNNIELRHFEEVGKAEKEALEKVRAEHPEYTVEDLKIKLSKNVMKDEEARKAKNLHNRNPQMDAQALLARHRAHGNNGRAPPLVIDDGLDMAGFQRLPNDNAPGAGPRNFGLAPFPHPQLGADPGFRRGWEDGRGGFAGFAAPMWMGMGDAQLSVAGAQLLPVDNTHDLIFGPRRAAPFPDAQPLRILQAPRPVLRSGYISPRGLVQRADRGRADRGGFAGPVAMGDAQLPVAGAQFPIPDPRPVMRSGYIPSGGLLQSGRADGLQGRNGEGEGSKAEGGGGGIEAEEVRRGPTLHLFPTVEEGRRRGYGEGVVAAMRAPALNPVLLDPQAAPQAGNLPRRAQPFPVCELHSDAAPQAGNFPRRAEPSPVGGLQAGAARPSAVAQRAEEARRRRQEDERLVAGLRAPALNPAPPNPALNLAPWNLSPLNLHASPQAGNFPRRAQPPVGGLHADAARPSPVARSVAQREEEARRRRPPALNSPPALNTPPLNPQASILQRRAHSVMLGGLDGAARIPHLRSAAAQGIEEARVESRQRLPALNTPPLNPAPHAAPHINNQPNNRGQAGIPPRRAGSNGNSDGAAAHLRAAAERGANEAFALLQEKEVLKRAEEDREMGGFEVEVRRTIEGVKRKVAVDREEEGGEGGVGDGDEGDEGGGNEKGDGKGNGGDWL